MLDRLKSSLLLFFALTLSVSALAQHAPFDGAERWKTGLAKGGFAAIEPLYSTAPPARFVDDKGAMTADISPEFDFWKKLAAGSKFEVSVQRAEEDQGVLDVALLVKLTVATAKGERARYVVEQQAWQLQKDGWKIVAATHSELLKMRPLEKLKKIYNEQANAKAEIAAALAAAVKAHQRVILVFGGNWCPDCQILDQAMHEPLIAPLVEKHFRIVHVDIGHGVENRLNQDVADKYKTPLNKGVPVLAVIDSDGKLLYSQQNGEWESARSLDPDEIVEFLEKWKK